MLSLDRAQPVTVNGASLSVCESGEGRSLVCVHGGVSDLRTWSHQFEPFSKHYRTIAYSRRYFRPNAPIPGDAADPIAVHVDDLQGLISTLDAAPAHIVAHSWGALVALIAANETPDLCQSLVLIEPPIVSMHVSVPPGPSDMFRLLLTAPRLAIAIARLGATALGPAEKAFRRGDDKQAVAHFGNGILGKRYFQALSDERYQQVWDNRGPDRAQALHHDFPDLRGERFSDVRVPVLLVTGADSPTVFGLLIDSLLEHLPNARKLTIPHASHVVQEDAPGALTDAVLAFLESVES